MKKILNIAENVLINSECWTYYKFSIIQTIKNYEVWLSNHMKIYFDQNGNAIFGENGNMYPLSHFFDILSIYDGNIFSVTKDNIVDYLIDKINQDTYIIIDLNYPRINGVDDVFWLHETLIYGYDTQTKEFLTPLLSDSGFKKSKIRFKVTAK